MPVKLTLTVLVLLGALIAAVDLFWAHGFIHLLGIDTQQSDNYDFVSGVGPMIITAIGYLGMITAIVHHLNCHVKGCPRLARYPVADGSFKVCRKHHPEEEVRNGLSVHHIHKLHQEYKDRSAHETAS